jgi:hypothetical protein
MNSGSSQGATVGATAVSSWDAADVADAKGTATKLTESCKSQLKMIVVAVTKSTAIAWTVGG